MEPRLAERMVASVRELHLQGNLPRGVDENHQLKEDSGSMMEDLRRVYFRQLHTPEWT